MPAAPYGQFGTSSYPYQTIPSAIIGQYPGSQNLRTALGMYTNLLGGQLAPAGGDLAAAQATDPGAQSYEEQVAGGFPTANAALTSTGNLFGGAFGAVPAQQGATQAQQNQALKGISNVGMDLANNMQGLQMATDKLETAQDEAQAQQMKDFMDITNLFTSPQGLGANIMSQVLGYPSGTSPISGIISGLGGLFSGGAGAGPGLGAAMGSSGMSLGDISSIFSSLGGAGGTASGIGDAMSLLPDLLMFAA
jgi:hypothetical protein